MASSPAASFPQFPRPGTASSAADLRRAAKTVPRDVIGPSGALVLQASHHGSRVAVGGTRRSGRAKRCAGASMTNEFEKKGPHRRQGIGPRHPACQGADQRSKSEATLDCRMGECTALVRVAGYPNGNARCREQLRAWWWCGRGADDGHVTATEKKFAAPSATSQARPGRHGRRRYLPQGIPTLFATCGRHGNQFPAGA
ncbi:hypothetical protein BC567DRAFT_87957 [Phyllosticta citribraziliensis]